MHARYAVTLERGISRHVIRERAAAAGLEIKVDRPSLLVLADPQTPIIANGDRILIGQIFDENGRRQFDLDSVLSNQDRMPRAGSWGNFLLLDADEYAPLIYRDPSGSIPVYEVGANAGFYFMSDAELARSLGLLGAPELDLGFAAHWLQFPFLRTERTGIAAFASCCPDPFVAGEAAAG